MPRLNLPTVTAKIRADEHGNQIWDPIRKKYVALTPEEWVRQHVVNYLCDDLNYPASLIAIEMGLKLNGMHRRADIVIHNRLGNPIQIIECKEPRVKIDEAVFDQIARYNFVLKVPYLVVTNGLDHYCCAMHHEEERWTFLKQIPSWEELMRQA